MDEMELIQWITRLKKTVSELEGRITELEEDRDDLAWQNEQLQKIIDGLPVELTPRDD